MSELKRLEVKYIRDKIKSQYKKSSNCEICDTTDFLEYHHYSSVAELYKKWASENGMKPTTVEEIIDVRDKFLSIFHKEMVEDCTTLCKTHHTKLHKVYGKNPPLHTAGKQERWVGKQRDKFLAAKEL